MSGHNPYPDDFQVEAERNKQLREEALQELHGDVRWLMSERRGRLFLARILRACRFGEDVFISNGTVNAFEQGRQSVGNWVSALIDELPDGVDLRRQMQNEDRQRFMQNV